MTFQERLNKLQMATGWLKAKEVAEQFGLQQRAISLIINGGKCSAQFVRKLKELEDRHSEDLKALDDGYIRINYTRTGKVRRKDWRNPVLRPADLAAMVDEMGAGAVVGSGDGPRRAPKVCYFVNRKCWPVNPRYRADGPGRCEPDSGRTQADIRGVQK